MTFIDLILLLPIIALAACASTLASLALFSHRSRGRNGTRYADMALLPIGLLLLVIAGYAATGLLR